MCLLLSEFIFGFATDFAILYSWKALIFMQVKTVIPSLESMPLPALK